ncbi:MAG: putative sulfate transporter [Chlamydiales bacterium]|nr:putative sulfate transporter [Chlamydiales bacterium]MCH9636256.1 putative sulfate transporter [Chlamydiales bacterium]MCH9703308.1 SulP family inorganic anion transporter [Chlamydiota bacterium]
MQLPPISPAPFWHDLKRYQPNYIWRDLFAALSVALLALPQAIAYAFVADLPPSVGIFAAIFGTIFTAAFGTSRYLVSGPTTAIAILIQSGVAQILFTFYRNQEQAVRDAAALNILMQIVLIVGIFQIIASLLRLGRITQFVSRSVILGYMLGVAVAIVVNQLYPFFGIDLPIGHSPIYIKAWEFIAHLHLIDWATAILGTLCFFAIFFLYRISKKIPVPLIVLALAAVVVRFIPFPIDTIEKLGPLYTDLPKLRLPQFELQLLLAAVPVAFAIALISLLEATSVGRYYTRSKEPPYRDNQELFGLGIANFFSAFLTALPSSGSFSRTALNRALNAKSRFASLLSGLVLLLIVLALADSVAKIPTAALSALLFYIAYSMVNVKDLSLCFKATRTDRFVLIATFLASLTFALDVALYIGIILSIVLYLKEASVPVVIEYDFTSSGKLRPMEPDDQRQDPRVSILQTEGHLFFGASEVLQTKIRRLSEDDEVKVVILQLFNVWTIDASICLALRQIHRYLKATDRKLMITAISPEVKKILHKSGVDKEIGLENIFLANDQLPSEPTRAAYAQAKSI